MLVKSNIYYYAINLKTEFATLFSKVFTKKWLIPIMQVLGSHVLLQIMGFAISIILVRYMPKNDFAIYTLLMSVLAILTVLSNAGMMTGFKTIGGRVWKNKVELAKLINSAFKIRRYLSYAAYFVGCSFSIYVLLNQGADYKTIILFTTCIILLVSPEINKAILSQALLLTGNVADVQRAQLINQVVKLGCIILAFVISYQYLTISNLLIISIFGAWISYLFIRKKSKGLVISKVEESKEYERELMHYVKLNWHNSIFFAFKGQISIFLIGIFGSTVSLANLGALTRYSLIFALINSVISNLMAPAFWRCQDIQKLKTFYLISVSSIIVLLAVLVFSIQLFSTFLLQVLGDLYLGLNLELFLVVVNGALASIIYLIHTYNITKGWIKFSPRYQIPLEIIAIILGVFLFDISTINGVMLLGIIGHLSKLALYLVNSYHGMTEYHAG